jgi:hypothetical protein
MKLLRLATLACALSAGLVGIPAHAQADTAAERTAAAHALMQSATSVLDMDRIVRQMRDGMLGPLTQAVRQQNPQLTPQQLQRAAQVMSQAIDEQAEAVMRRDMPRMMALMETFYAQNFNVSELQELQRYYASPTVRKSMQLLPDFMPQMMKPMMDDMVQDMPAIQSHMQQALAQLKAEGIELKQ